MSILLKRAIEPGSRASTTQPPILAGSQVAQKLRRILKRYVEGSVTGRSFLISGHRGAGKTTLVKKVVQEVAKDFEGHALRPLLVSLSGPMLLPPTDSGPPPDETKIVLEQLTVNLYRALARHFAECYASRMIDQFGPLVSNERPQDPSLRMEMAADFRRKLDGPIELSELRAFWQYCDALDGGILFPPNVTKPFGQGYREIIAVWSCLRAYISLAAEDYKEKAGATDTAGRKGEVTAKTPGDKGVFSALVGVGSGSAVGAGLLAAGQQTPLAIFSAIATAVGASLLVNYSGSRTRESANTMESSITIKRDMQSLARELPELMQRCRDAGIVPVFLIDELDKVEHLEKRMQSLIFSTKLLVTEQSVFFFVTDRSYYEYIERVCREAAYPREHTFFSERLFVSYQAGDWRSYISEILIPGSSEREQQDQEEKAIEVLGFALMCRSRMHAIDLRRAIGAVAEVPATPVREDVESIINIRSDDLMKQRRYLFEILIQVAVEVTLLSDPDFSGRCVIEPPFTQIAYDTLYYLARKWEVAPQSTFVLDEEEFREWLDSRSEGVASSSEDSDMDISYLLRKVGDVLHWLRNPAKLAADPRAKSQFGPAVLEMVLATQPLVEQKEDGRYAWRYDTYGRALHPETVERVRQDQELKDDRQLVREISDLIKEITYDKIGLGAIQKVGLLLATPPVSAVFEGLVRLQNLDANPVAYPEMDEDVQCVRAVAKLLREGAEILARAMVSAWLLARCAPMSNDNPGRFLVGWGVLADRLFSKSASTEQTCEHARNLFYRLQGRYTTDQNPYIKIVNLEQGRSAAWGDSIRTARDRILSETYAEKSPWTEIEADAWLGWADTSLRFLRNVPFEYGRITDHTVNELMASARGNPALPLLKPDLSTVSIADWSRLIIFGRLNTYSSAPDWVQYLSIIALGLTNTGITQISPSSSIATGFPDDLRKELENRLASPQTTTRPKLLVIRANQNSICTSWLVDNSYECLVFKRTEVAELVPTSDQVLIGSTFVLVEIEPSENLEALAAKSFLDLQKPFPFLGWFNPSLNKMALMTAQPVTLIKSTVPVISAPLSVKDAVTRLQAIPSTNPPMSSN